MADKKKKLFPPKDPITSRRPVILKSDREPSKDLERDKPKEKTPVEKERQPTILLKAREPSTPKEERPQSPKVQGNDADSHVLQPCKIAQNESKEKRILDQKVCVPIPPMLAPVKLLDENFEFNNSAAEFLHDGNSNYLVVGILGMQGVGKSLIMNLLAHTGSMDTVCSKILTSHEMPPGPEREEEVVNVVEEQLEKLNFVENQDDTKPQEVTESYFKFKMQDMEQMERSQHCTKGVDMYVTNDRVILLDSQALWSPSALDEGAATGANPVTLRGSTVATVDCLQLASYLMAVCHVLIVVQDWFTDCNFLRFIQTAEMLKPSLSASNSAASVSQEGAESTSAGENHPHLLLLQNCCQLEDFTPDSVTVMQDLYRQVFEKSNLQLNSGMYLYSDTNKNGLNIEAVGKGLSVDKCGVPINLFLLPEVDEDHDNQDIYRGHPTFEELAARLRWMVYGVSRHQITSVPNLSEKGWFHFCIKAWETTRKCTFFMEYGRLLP